MSKQKFQLILASQSPRRKELVGYLGIPFQIICTDCNELDQGDSAEFVACENAKLKGEATFLKIGKSMENPLVVASDTVVHFADQILGKPQSTEEARDMLLKLSGKWHEVITAVYVQSYDQHLIFSCSTDVHFRDISCDILDQYLSTGDSLDKAGSYGVQGAGLLFIDQVRGSYSNVVGFPLSIFMVRLKEFIGATESDDYRSFFI